MAYNYGHGQYQQIPDQYNLKPVGYTQTNQYGAGYGNGNYQQASPQPYSSFEGAELERLSTQDETLKYRIRLLRIVSRVLATIISAATLAPLTMTLIKFIQTRDQVLTVDGEQRTAWASGTRAWYTYLYFAISAISFILNAVILISYCGGTKKANRVSTISGWFHGLIMAGNIIVWIVSVAIYRYGKIPQDGRFTDLWGWTCSTAADEIQSQVTNIDYSKYCTAQTSSFYTGIAQVVTSLLTASIYAAMFMRMRSKKRLLKAEVRQSQSHEPLRR